MLYRIPGLPVTTNAGFKTGRGRFYETKEYREFKDLCKLVVRPHDPVTYDIELYVALHVNRPRDIDGSLKCLLDGLEGCLYANDRQIKKLDVVLIEKTKKLDVCTLVQRRAFMSQERLALDSSE